MARWPAEAALLEGVNHWGVAAGLAGTSVGSCGAGQLLLLQAAPSRRLGRYWLQLHGSVGRQPLATACARCCSRTTGAPHYKQCCSC